MNLGYVADAIATLTPEIPAVDTMKTRPPAKRNPMARAVRTALFRTRVVKPKRGRGAYTRKGRNAGKS
jgi:stalled ribosome alternative rescue factor ArfA